MLSKFSVKKPYTIVVGVIMVLILGFVSMTEMTTDLLPSMNLPYAIVMTTYVGASPEEVEQTVTRPIEQSMATISNIMEINSVSSENYSMVVLEFAEDANMDSVSLEMRESLDQMESLWDNESIGNPIIMKLNPDMMPVMVAAVSSEDMDALELTDFAEHHITSDLESIAGVASVSVSGEVEQNIQVILREEKIAEVNEWIYAALDGEFEDAKQQIADGRKELADGQKELNDGMKELEKGEADLKKNEADLEKGIEDLEKGKEELDKTKTKTAEELAKQQVALQNQKKQLLDQKEQINQLLQQQQTAIAQVGSYETSKQQLAAFAEQLKQLEAFGMTPDQIKEQLTTSAQGMIPEEILSILETAGWSSSGLQAYIVHMDGQLITAKAELGAINAACTQVLTAMNQAMGTEYTTLEEAVKGIDELIAAIDKGMEQLLAGNTTASIEMGSATALLQVMGSQLDSAKSQLKSAKDQIEKSKDTLLSSQEQLNDGKKQLNESEEQLLEAIADARENASAQNVLTADVVKSLLAAQNFSMPAGYVTEDGIDYLIRVGDKVEDAKELEQVTLIDLGMEGLEPIILSDVADVIVTDNSSESYAKINGNDGLMLTMQKQTGYSTGDVSKKIKNRFQQLEEEYPQLHFIELMDQGIYIDMIVHSVMNNMLSGAVLAIIILFVFLKDIRPTFIIACSIPFSVLAAVVLMYFSNITLNVISLSGLALGIGMLVDNSIVVIENIYRMRSEGASPKEAAIEGAREVSGAIIASTLTTVCVFAPIVFMKGITKQIFIDMGLTIAYSLLASLIVALTLVPTMGAGLLKESTQKEHKLLDRFHEAYGKTISKALDHKVIVLLVSVVLLVGSIGMALSNGTAFMPEMESTQLSATVTLEEGSTVAEVGEMTDIVLERIAKIPDVTDVGAMVGSSSGMGALTGGGSTTQSSVYILLDEKKTQSMDEISARIIEATSDLDCEVAVQTQNMDMSALGGSGVSITIKGKELDVLYDLAKTVAAEVEAVEGTANVSDGMEETTDELRIRVDKGKAGLHNLTVAQVLQQVAAKIQEASSATILSTDEKDYEVFVTSEEASEYSREDVKNMILSVKDAEGKTKKIPLADIAEFEEAQGLQSINRISQTRYITVTADVADGYNIGLIGNELEARLKKLSVPNGYSIKLAGENEMINEAMVEVLKLMALAIVFIYLIMVAQFQSLKSPFIVMFTIPLAFTGGFLALVLTGMEVSVIAMIGFVMLAGIIVNNGIVLVDYVNQLRESGIEKREALIIAGKTRLRPIVMTALTTILGLSTLALGFGMGADMAQPMAVVAIGGLIYGTILTLWVVPCIYDILNPEKKKKFKKKKKSGKEELA